MISAKERRMSDKTFYLTTTLPYVNAEPHLGHALEFVRADVIVRYKKSLGYDVFFNTGTDEHGAKILEGAIKEGIPAQEYVNRNAVRFQELFPKLGITRDIHFIRTTDAQHILAAQEMWKRCHRNGYIYKKEYQATYCVGCELYKTDSELVDGKCPIHPNRDVEIIEEENYFFAFSKLENKLRELYTANPKLVIPDFRFNEIKAFLDRGLEDFSISRLKSKMSWGVPVPGDDEHVMYVWFDALTSYISTLGWPAPSVVDGSSEGDFEKYWVGGNPVQYCGKDNLRQQSAIWQAMLIAADLPNTKNIIIDGFIISGGQKMSKSIGNVINPFDVIDMFKGFTDYPEDVLRFIVLHEVPSFDDGDITIESIKTAYTAHLANGIGNLTNRIMKMFVTYQDEAARRGINVSDFELLPLRSEFMDILDAFDTNRAIHWLSTLIQDLDKDIQEKEAYKLIKEDFDNAFRILLSQKAKLFFIAFHLQPFLPRTSDKILECIRENKMPEKPLFNRLS